MILERGVRQTLRHQGHNRHHAAVSKGKPVFSAPHLAEQHIVIELCKFGAKSPRASLPAVCLIVMIDFLLSMILDTNLLPRS